MCNRVKNMDIIYRLNNQLHNGLGMLNNWLKRIHILYLNKLLKEC
jgi:hypothetical protein